MTLHNLNKVYQHQLQDLHSASQQSMDAAMILADVVSNAELKDLLTTGAQDFRTGMEKLQSICSRHGIESAGDDCHGVRALITETKHQALEADFTDDATRDAMIITKYQRIVHYTSTGYSCIVVFAKRLELTDDAQIFKEQLTQINKGERRLSRLASGLLDVQAA